MCRLWLTEPSESIELNYFVIDGGDFYIDEFRGVLADLEYDCPIDFISAEKEVCRISKGNNAVLLHTPTIGQKKYITGLIAPIIENTTTLTWNMKLQGLTMWLLTGDLCIVMLMILLATFSGMQGMEQLERLFTQYTAAVIGIPLFLFAVLLVLLFLFNRSNISEQNHKAAEMVRLDFGEALERLCSDFHTENIKATNELPREIEGALVKLVSLLDGVDRVPGSVLDIKIPSAENKEYRSYS